jgi:lysophospholipase L1-like esterase
MNKKNILCYGDSNTWGFVPIIFDYETFHMERYSRGLRWPGFMQNLLGNDYFVIEEGLNGRTTDVEYPDILARSGISYLEPCLYSHSPLDLVIILLGVNDLKVIFNRSIKDISVGLEKLIKIIKKSPYGKDLKSAPEILVVGPPHLLHEGYLDADNEPVFTGGMEKSNQFNDDFSNLAKNNNCHYINLGNKVKVSEIDGLHLDKVGHAKVGKLMASAVKNILSPSKK